MLILHSMQKSLTLSCMADDDFTYHDKKTIPKTINRLFDTAFLSTFLCFFVCFPLDIAKASRRPRR